jgi:hypothetical protein
LLLQILHELQTTQRPISLDDLGRRLGVERSVLEGMIQTLVRMGRLHACVPPSGGKDDSDMAATCGAYCADCAAAQSCALAAKLPASYSLATQQDANCG